MKETISKTVKNGLHFISNIIKSVLLQVIKLLVRIPYLCVATIPFLNSFIPSAMVLWVWIPMLTLSLLLDLYLYKKHSKNPPIKTRWAKTFDDLTHGASVIAFAFLLSALIINYFDTAYDWSIAIAVVLFIVIPFSINGMFDFIKEIKCENQSYPVNFTKVKIQYILFYWLVDAFYISICMSWDIGKFMFGGIALLILLYSVASSFLSQKIKYKWLLIHDFAITMALTVYLIYIIPDESVKNAILVLTSAVYGGFIALVGVAWTIKDGQQREAESKRLEKMPYLQVEIGEWIASDRRELTLPGLWLTISPSTNNNIVSSGASIKITNIGLGMANNLQYRFNSSAVDSNYAFSTTLVRCDATFSENVIFTAGRPSSACTVDSILYFRFDDLLGNHYEQRLDIAFEINVGHISMLSYKMNAPVFLGRDN